MTVPTVVVDASAIAAVLFIEARGADVLRQIDGCDLMAPPIIQHEIVSVAMKKDRLRPDLRREWIGGLRRFPGLLILERPIVPAAVFALAVETGLTAYDASYLWLARQLGARLVTLDGDLAEAAMVA